MDLPDLRFSAAFPTLAESCTSIGLQDRDTILLPRRSDAWLTSPVSRLSIAKVLEFSSQTLRSGAVVLSEDAPSGSALLFLRGAPAVIRSLVNPATVPHDFDQVGVSDC